MRIWFGVVLQRVLIHAGAGLVTSKLRSLRAPDRLELVLVLVWVRRRHQRRPFMLPSLPLLLPLPLQILLSLFLELH